MPKNNKLFLISGASGVGKTTIMRRVMTNEVISFTTRKKRIGEVDGKDYIFLTKEEYINLLNNNQLIESVEYSGNYYGITKEELENKLNKDHAFCIVDFNGMKQLKEIYPNCTTIFIYTSIEEAMKQMSIRGDSMDSITKRISTYNEEMANRIYYDYVIKNSFGKLDKVVEVIKKIVELEVSN